MDAVCAHCGVRIYHRRRRTLGLNRRRSVWLHAGTGSEFLRRHDHRRPTSNGRSERVNRAEIHLTTRGWAVSCGCGWHKVAVTLDAAAAERGEHNRRHARMEENAGQVTLAFAAFALLIASAAIVLISLMSTAGSAR